MVTVIYKSPQDLALSDRPSSLSPLFTLHQPGRPVCCSWNSPTLGDFAVPTSAPPRPGMLFSPHVCSFTFLSFSRFLVTGYFLKEALQGYPYKITPVLDHSLPPHPASFCFMTLRM